MPGKRTPVEKRYPPLTCGYEVGSDHLTDVSTCGDPAIAKWEWRQGYLLVCRKHDREVARIDAEAASEQYKPHAAWCRVHRPDCCDRGTTTGTACVPCRAAFQAGEESRAELMVECETCHVPMLVRREHGSWTSDEIAAITRMFGDRVRWGQRKIKDHAHCHLILG